MFFCHKQSGALYSTVALPLLKIAEMFRDFFPVPLRMGGDAEHHHHPRAGGAARAGEVHQLQRSGPGLHTGRRRGPQQRPVYTDPRGP